MDKFDKKNIIIFILVAIVFILGSAWHKPCTHAEHKCKKYNDKLLF